jgi:opacity protein-like surface antigen
MKKLTFSVLAAFAVAATSLAGHEVVSSGKSYKDKVIPAETCFLDNELQIDVFGAYTDGNHPHAGYLNDHGWGGGIGLNYFFTRNIGVGVDATWLYGRDNQGDNNGDNDHTVTHNFTGSLIFRFPSDSTCLSPYVFVGGGFHVDGEQWASAHAGVGLEYRIVPNKIGLFTDARFTYFGDRFGDGDQNNIGARAGIRFVF